MQVGFFMGVDESSYEGMSHVTRVNMSLWETYCVKRRAKRDTQCRKCVYVHVCVCVFVYVCVEARDPSCRWACLYVWMSHVI